ncbi:MAG: hypothetical protein J6Q38_03935, partial [Clostridia bacterium]|nr:hypothetical protein [Clostridia bacterium]
MSERDRIFASSEKIIDENAPKEEIYAMSTLVTEQVAGAITQKSIANVSLVHGKWGEYKAFDGMYNVTPDDEDQVYASDSVALRGDQEGISTYIKRYQISATKNNDAVFKFTFNEDARLYLCHGTFGGDFNNNWATHASWLLVQETEEGAVIIKEMPTQSVTSDNMYFCDVHGKKGDTVYVIYRMKGDTTVPGHNYANMFIDCSFIFKTADYLLSERDRIFASSEKVIDENAPKEEIYTMSSLVTEQVAGGIATKEIADISLVHGKFGEYKAFEENYNAYVQEGAVDNDKVIASDSIVQVGEGSEKKTFIGRYMLSATRKNDAVFKFTFKKDAKLYISHGTFGGDFNNNWATHASFMIVQETSDGAYVVKETNALPTVVENMFSGEVNGKAGDVIYVIYRMKGETTVPDHEYANIFLDYAFTLKEADYVESERTSVLVSDNLYVENIEEAYTMSALVTEQVNGGISSKVLADVSLVHGKFGEYTAFDEYYNAYIQEGSIDNDKVIASDSLVSAGEINEKKTYIGRYILSASKKNDAVFKFVFKEDAKLYISHGAFGGSFDANWATHASFMIVQETADGIYTIKEVEAMATVVANMFSGEVNGKAGDIIYVIYRMNGATTVPGHEYANIFLDYT